MTEVVGQIGPCHCSAHDGPHHHVDDFTIMPWAEFERSFEAFAKSVEPIADFEGYPATLTVKDADGSVIKQEKGKLKLEKVATGPSPADFAKIKLEVLGVSFVTEDQLVDKHTRISISSKTKED